MFFRSTSPIIAFYCCTHEPRIENPFDSYINPSSLLPPRKPSSPSTILFLQYCALSHSSYWYLIPTF